MGGRLLDGTAVDRDRLRTALLPVLGPRVESFLAAGLAALDRPDRTWLQVGLPVGGGRDTFAALDRLIAGLLERSEVTNAYVMRKPPGLRVRFEFAAARPEGWDRGLRVLLAAAVGVPAVVELGVYEPEQHLFGGPASMPYVHRVFTVDTRAWLTYHTLAAPPPAWMYSLLLLRSFLDGAGIVGWEDLDVWARIRDQAGRRLPAGLTERRLRAAAAGIRDAWADPDSLRGMLPDDAAGAVDTWAPRLRDTAAEWREAYLRRADASIGAREAAAFATIFHWNRGGLPAGTQALLAEALSDRSARP